MKPILFTKEHLPQIRQWISFYQNSLEEEYLSPIGLIIPNHCASFLVLTNTPLAFVDPTVANIALNKEIRNQSLDILGQAMWDLAKSYGVKKMIGISNLPKVIQRAQNHGFTLTEDKLFYKDI